MQTGNKHNIFVVRDSGFLTVEESILLEDWEFILCNKSALESVCFLPRLQRCFKRVDLFLSVNIVKF